MNNVIAVNPSEHSKLYRPGDIFRYATTQYYYILCSTLGGYQAFCLTSGKPYDYAKEKIEEAVKGLTFAGRNVDITIKFNP